MLFPLLLALVLSLAALLFAFQNAQPASVAFLVWRFESSISVALFLSFVIGLVAGVLMLLPTRVRAGLAAVRGRREIEALRARLDEAEAQLKALESAPGESASAGPQEGADGD